MLEIVTAISLWELTKHASRWIANLQRARIERKRQSVQALRKVIIAARKTTVYLRQLKETGTRSHAAEAELSTLWTELGFALKDLGMEALSRRCHIKGKEWADPTEMDPLYLAKADVGLARMEQLAIEILHDIESAR